MRVVVRDKWSRVVEDRGGMDTGAAHALAESWRNRGYRADVLFD